MSATRINRYITREILSPTLLCIVIFTMVMVMGRAFKLADLVISKGVSLSDILILLATLLPTSLSISLPLAFLMGIMIGLGRMSADNETIALKSAGIGLSRMATPVFILAFFFALLTGATNIWLQPWCYKAFATKSFEIVQQKATIGFQPRVFMNQFNDLVLYANDIDGRANQMSGLLIVEKKPEATSWVFADSGSIITDKNQQTVTIRLHDGVIHRQQTKSKESYQLIHFRNYDVQPEIDAISGPAERTHFKPRELTIGQLLNGISSAEKPMQVQGLKAELHMRLTSPLAPLLFVLFGLPFSMQSHRSGRSGGFVMGLIIFFGYYFILSTAATLTKDAAISPLLTYWTPHILLAGAGLFFFRQFSQEKPNFLAVWIDQVLLNLQKRVQKHDNP